MNNFFGNILKRCFCLIPIILFIFGCQKKENDDPDVSGSLAQQRIELAAGVADHFILPGFKLLKEDGDRLKELLDGFKSDLTQDNLNTLRAHLAQIRQTWQKVELFVFGPAETFALRSTLNTYPTNVDKIKNNISTGVYTIGTVAQVDAGGFPALDYLLHNPELSDSDIISAFLNDAERLNYLTEIIINIQQSISTVENSWNESDFLEKFKSAESGGTDVGSAMGILINAFDLHFQRFLRDGKVAIPAGVRSAGVIRPTATEAYYAGYSLTLLEEAINNYLDLFKGEGLDGQGFNSLFSYLKALGREDLVIILENGFSKVLQQIAVLNDPLSLQISENVEPVTTLFILLQDIVTTMKADVVSAIGVTLTNQDNDGD